MKFFAPRELKAEFQAPNHLHRFANLETECRDTHLTARSQNEERAERHAGKVAKVVEAVWAEGFTAGVAHALATMSVKYILVTEEERAKMIERIES